MKDISRPSLLNLACPLPKFEAQKQRAAELASARGIAANKRAEAAALRQSACGAFDLALFTASGGSAA